MIKVELQVIGGKHSGQVIKLNHKKFLIGREQDCHLRPNSEMVSRHHCIFTLDDFSLRLRDLGSTNGTLVNGERLRKEIVLQPNDLVLVGNLEFKVVISEAADSAPAQSPISHEDTIVAGSDTLSEMPPIKIPDAMAASEQSSSAASTASEPVTQQAPTPLPPVEPTNPTPAVPLEMIPQAHSGDTTIISQPVMMPGQTMYPGMPQQPMGYPMYQNYQYPGMPMQMPMHPGQMMPQPMMPGYGMPNYGMPNYPQPQAPAPAAPPAVEPDPEPTAAGGIAVSLPDPAETGLKAPPPPPPKPEGGEAKQEEKSNASAAAIIQKHMQRRPGV